MEFKKAERHRVKLKLAISAPSGGGKTYSALLMAKGLCGQWNKICVIDTENDSASLYAHLGDFNTIPLRPPFTPERYVEAIALAERNNQAVIIIDSMSHEWENEGGALDLQAALGGKYQDWAKVTPRHRKFMQAILQVDRHIIATMRRKTEYAMTEDGRGKKTITKMGMKEVQRDGTEYEFTTHFALDQRHFATVEKDRTGLFDGKPEFKITEQTGKDLLAWANAGIDSNYENQRVDKSNPPDPNKPSDTEPNAPERESYGLKVPEGVKVEYLYKENQELRPLFGIKGDPHKPLSEPQGKYRFIIHKNNSTWPLDKQLDFIRKVYGKNHWYEVTSGHFQHMAHVANQMSFDEAIAQLGQPSPDYLPPYDEGRYAP